MPESEIPGCAETCYAVALHRANAIQAVAHVLGIEVSLLDLRETVEIESAIGDFARQPNGGLIVTTTALAQIHRAQLIALAAKHRGYHQCRRGDRIISGRPLPRVVGGCCPPAGAVR